MILYMYIAPGQGQITPWGQNFDVNRKASLLCPFLCKFQNKSHWSLILHIFFHASLHIYSPRTGADNPCKFRKKVSLKSDFIHTFNDFIHAYSPRAVEDNTYWLKSDFIHIFHAFIHVYSPTRWGKILMSTEKLFFTLPICCKFQISKTSLWNLKYYTYFWMLLYMYIAPGQGQTTLWGQMFYSNINLLSLLSFLVSFFH